MRPWKRHNGPQYLSASDASTPPWGCLPSACPQLKLPLLQHCPTPDYHPALPCPARRLPLPPPRGPLRGWRSARRTRPSSWSRSRCAGRSWPRPWFHRTQVDPPQRTGGLGGHPPPPGPLGWETGWVALPLGRGSAKNPLSDVLTPPQIIPPGIIFLPKVPA